MHKISNGKYKIEGMRFGKCRVEIISDQPAQNSEDEPQDGETSVKIDARKWFPIPEIYGDAQTTPLTVDLEKDIQSADFQLEMWQPKGKVRERERDGDL